MKNQQNDLVIFELDDGRLIQAHRSILAAQSDYFQLLLFDLSDGFLESSRDFSMKIKKIRLHGKRAEPFSYLLSCLYASPKSPTAGGVYLNNLSKLSLGCVFDLLKMAHELLLDGLFGLIVNEFLVNVINVENVLFLYFDVALVYQAERLRDACLYFIYEWAAKLVRTSHFYQMPLVCLAHLLERDEFALASEGQLLEAARRWWRHQPSKLEHHQIDNLRRVVESKIRFLFVKKWEINDEISLFLSEIGIDSKKLAGWLETPSNCFVAERYRPFVATSNMAYRVKKNHRGQVRNRRAMVSGLYTSTEWRRNVDPSLHTCHPLRIGDQGDHDPISGAPYGVTVVLRQTCLVGSMLIDLPLVEGATWSYRVDTSVDKIRWQPLARQVNCYGGSQLLLFDYRKLRYARIQGFINVDQKDADKLKRHGDDGYFYIINFECPASSITKQENEQFATSSAGQEIAGENVDSSCYNRGDSMLLTIKRDQEPEKGATRINLITDDDSFEVARRFQRKCSQKLNATFPKMVAKCLPRLKKLF